MGKVKKSKPKVEGISFKEHYSKEHEFLLKQHNKSQFICELLRSYMEGKNILDVKSTEDDKNKES